MDAPPFVPADFPGNSAEVAATVDASIPVQTDADPQGWRVLAILSVLMGFASIATDIYLAHRLQMSCARVCVLEPKEQTEQVKATAPAILEGQPAVLRHAAWLWAAPIPPAVESSDLSCIYRHEQQIASFACGRRPC